MIRFEGPTGWAGQRSIVAKVRVYELAKEFGVESKAVMAKLEDMGEFVRSASSTIEAPVVRRLKEAFAAQQSQAAAAASAVAQAGADGKHGANGQGPALAEPAAGPADTAAGRTEPTSRLADREAPRAEAP